MNDLFIVGCSWLSFNGMKGQYNASGFHYYIQYI